jgi:hypothetical protein
MPRQQRRKPQRASPKRTASTESAFLNIPYDAPFENLYLAYIAGVTAFGLKPRAALEIPTSNRRLERILELIQEREYSIHDLSRVQLDRTPPSTPRFNMPFELGLTVALEKVAIPGRAWVVCETQRFRLKKSLTDLDGTDPYIHDGTVRGLFRELGNAFVRNRNQPTVDEMMKVYRILRANLKAYFTVQEPTIHSMHECSEICAFSRAPRRMTWSSASYRFTMSATAISTFTTHGGPDGTPPFAPFERWDSTSLPVLRLPSPLSPTWLGRLSVRLGSDPSLCR